MKHKVPFHHLGGIFIISFATLLLELSLTRVLSVALWYHFGFLIISTALLGFGAAGVTLSVSKWLRDEAPFDKTLSLLSVGFALSTVVSFWIMQKIPFDPFSLLSDKNQLLYMPLYYIVVLVPFYFSGMVIGLLLTRSEAAVNRLYALDLLGAGLGCAAIALVMPELGGSGSVIISAAFGAIAAAVFAWNSVRTLSAVSIAICIALTVTSFFGEKVLHISISVNKAPRLRTLTPVYSAWNTFSKIDVYDFPADTSKNLPGSRRFIIDGGTAATGIDDLSNGIDNVLEMVRNKTFETSVDSKVAALGKTNLKVLIIGSGAGDEIFECLILGASSITAVELNPIIVDVQVNKMKEYWGGLHNKPQVKIVVDEGRNFVKRSNEKYDIIICRHTISNAAVASGALSLAENYVLTREAFVDYLDHLTPDGVLFFTRPEIQIQRLFTTASEILLKRGLRAPGKHMYAFAENRPLDRNEKHMFYAGFLLKKSPLLREEVEDIQSFLKINDPDTLSDISNKELYSPFNKDSNSIYQEIVSQKDFKTFYAQQAQLLEPATDDKPFFNQHAKWSSLSLNHFIEIFKQDRRGRLALEDLPVAEITLLIILFQSMIISGILILLPLWKFSRQGLRIKGKWNFLLYFAGLGLGFILIEIALLQRFNLYLGQPVYTLAVILASLLVFTGFGSYLAERFDPDPRAILIKLVPTILAVLLITAVTVPFVFDATLHLALLARVSISIILVAPLGIVLGMPFPLGLRIISKEAGALTPWAWGVNGFFTVIGTVSAMICGMAFGFTIVMVIASVCYAGAGLVIGLRRQQIMNPQLV